MAIKKDIQICCICPFDLHDKQKGLLIFVNMAKKIQGKEGNTISKYIMDFVSVLTRELINYIRRELSLRKIYFETFGFYLYWTNRPANTSLIYSAPLRHNDFFYSKGIGRTWILTVK